MREVKTVGAARKQLRQEKKKRETTRDLLTEIKV
jgi:hypothetical protein